MREERLEDALQYIDELLDLLKNHVLTNDTPEGRTKHELRWFREEILSGRLAALPPPYEQTSTLRYVYCEEYFKNIDQPRQKRLKNLVSLLSEGHYLMKPQFYPLVIEEVDKMRAFLQSAESVLPVGATESVTELRKIAHDKITPAQRGSILRHLLDDLNLLRARFADHTIEPPPVDWADYMGATLATEKLVFGGHGSKSPEERQWARLRLLIFEGLRPDPDGKIRNRRW